MSRASSRPLGVLVLFAIGGLEPYHLYEMGPVRPFSEFPTAAVVRDP